MTSQSEIMSVSNLFAGYGETEILHGINLNVNDGEIVCVIGPNGAGKSTVLKAILGQINIRDGSINLADQDIVNTPTTEIIKKGISYVPQTNNCRRELGNGRLGKSRIYAKKTDRNVRTFSRLERKKKATGWISFWGSKTDGCNGKSINGQCKNPITR